MATMTPKASSGEKWYKCGRKNEYDTSEEALREARRISKEPHDYRPGEPLGVYECEFCDSWHIGHMPRMATRGICVCGGKRGAHFEGCEAFPS